MSSKPFTWKEIETAKDNNESLTISQTGKDAYIYIKDHFAGVTQNSLFYHKGGGVWANKGGTAKKIINFDKNTIKTPIIPDVKPPSGTGLIPELKGGFNRGIKPKNRIEVYSIEDVMRCTDKNIVGFLPIYKNGIILS